MNIKCPKCGEEFELDKSQADEIIARIKNDVFNKELESRLDQFKKLSASETELKIKDIVNEKEKEIETLKNKMSSMENDKKVALDNVKSANEIEIQKLNAKISEMNLNKELEISKAISAKESEILELKNQLSLKENQSKLDLSEALMNAKNESYKNEAQLKESYEKQLKEKVEIIEAKEKEVDYYKNLKLTMSTKMVGESLERHCEEDYNMHLRPLLPTAYFEKDNEISETGSKGDFIFKEELDGVPLLSIMFEMKNEMETTENKHKNEYFFKELDKDRREKGCEYAVLVSMLEADNEYYNQGIVDVSYRYPKMFVIRPQFLVPLITLLRNAALNAHSYRRELAIVQNQNIDVTNFESKLAAFKEGFSKSCKLTSARFEDAITQIDKAISDLQKVKDALTSSEKHLIAADNKLEDLTINKLTRGNPTMKKMFEEAKKETEDD